MGRKMTVQKSDYCHLDIFLISFDTSSILFITLKCILENTMKHCCLITDIYCMIK